MHQPLINAVLPIPLQGQHPLPDGVIALDVGHGLDGLLQISLAHTGQAIGLAQILAQQQPIHTAHLARLGVWPGPSAAALHGICQLIKSHHPAQCRVTL